MTEIMHNPENGSYGFRIVVRPARWNSGQNLDPNLAKVKAILREIEERGLTKDEHYAFSFPSMNDHGNIINHDFWFADRDTALLIKLAAG